MAALELLAAVTDEDLTEVWGIVRGELGQATMQHVPALDTWEVHRIGRVFAACAPRSIRQAGLGRSQTADNTHGAIFAALNDSTRNALALLFYLWNARVGAAAQLFALTLAPAGKLSRALAHL